MKFRICLLLIGLFFLNSCNFSDNSASDISATGYESGREDAPVVSSLRSYRETSMTALGEWNDSADYGFVKDGAFYRYVGKSDKDGYAGVLQCFDGTEIVSETDISMITDGEYLYIPHAVYPLKDDQYFCLYTASSLMGCIMRSHGEILHTITIADNANDYTLYAGTEENGEVYLLIYHHDIRAGIRTFHCYDDALNLRSTISDNTFSSTHILYFGDGVFGAGRTLRDLSILDMKTGTIRQTSLRMPDAYSLCGVVHGANDELYLLDIQSIERMRDDNMPKTILKYTECETPYQNNGLNSIWIIDDSTLYYTNQETQFGRQVSVLYAVTVSQIPASEHTREMIHIAAYSSASESLSWLTGALYHFNQTNDRYYADLTVHRAIRDDERQCIIENALLYDSNVDILIPDSPDLLAPYYEKNAFYDLMPIFGEILTGSIADGFSSDNALYQIPLQMIYRTLVASNTVCMDGHLTWEDICKMTNALTDDEILLSPICIGMVSKQGDSPMNVTPLHTIPIMQLYRFGMMEFVDRENAASDFSDFMFHTLIQQLQVFSEHIDTEVGGISLRSDTSTLIVGQSFVPRLRTGNIKLLEVEISHISDFASLQRCFGDTGYRICGYPTVYGESSYVTCSENPLLYLSVLENSDVRDGCLSLIEYLLSDAMQLHPEHKYLPVTDSAITALIDKTQYQYYLRDEIEMMESGGISYVYLTGPGISAEYLDDFGLVYDTEAMYEVYSFTEKEYTAIHEFFDASDLRVYTDQTIEAIVTEELSYWKSNARSLEETTKIIDSRVWIYLNE